MSDTNRVVLRAIEESTPGTTPATPAFFEVPSSGQPDLGFSPETVTSNLIRDDRQVSDLILVGGEAGGDNNSELAFEVHDRIYPGLFFNPFQSRLKYRNYAAAAAQITAVGASAYTVTNQGGPAVQNDIVRAENFANAANNGFKIVDAGATTTSVPIVGGGLTVEASPPTTARLVVVGRRAAAADIVAATSPNRITSTTLDFTTLSLQPGDLLVLRGTGGTWPATNDGFCRVLSVAANSLVFDQVPTGWAADPGTGATVDFYLGERIVNGVTRQAYTLEREFSDHSPVTYQYLRGFQPDQHVLTAASQSIVEVNTTFAGRTAPLQDSGRFAGATTLPTPPFQVLNSSSNVAKLLRGGVSVLSDATKNYITELSLTINNNLRRKNAVGFLGAADIGAGEFNVTGSLSSYFDDKSIADQVVNNTETSLQAVFQDSALHVVVYDIPRLKWSEGRPEVPGKNDDVIINPNFQALRDNVFGYTMKYMRFYGYQS